jgi:outer membrane protein assembly factor BamB
VDDSHIKLPSPDAPSFICLNRHTGKLVWSDNSPGKNVMHGQWASPAYATEPFPQVIFPGGDGWLHSFDPTTGKPLWKFDCNPKDSVYELGGTGTRNDFIAAPVVYDGRVYIGVGQDPEHSSGIANFFCVDPGGRGDVSKYLETREKGPDGKEKIGEKPNPNSREVWRYGWLETRKYASRDFKFGRTLSTACVVDGLVYAPELAGYLHCLDAKPASITGSTIRGHRSGAPRITWTVGCYLRPTWATCSCSGMTRIRCCSTRLRLAKTPRR